MSLVLLSCAAVLGWAGAWWVSRRGRLDPLERRRLHTAPTPRGGGIGIACAGLLSIGATVMLTSAASEWHGVCAGLGLLAAAAAGAWEDRWGLAARWRLLAHLLAATLIVHATQSSAPYAVQFVLVVAVAGFINLVNFMDGAHGLIGLQGLALGFALDQPMLGLACLGFLPMNFPHARVFLGDVGSYAIGAWIAYAWLSLGALVVHPATLLMGWILLLPILIDAGWTLLTRIVRGRRWYSAHREHLYQWFIRTGFRPWTISLGYFSVTVALGLLLLPAVGLRVAADLWLLAIVLTVCASGVWWWGKQYCLVRHRRQLRAALAQRRSDRGNA